MEHNTMKKQLGKFKIFFGYAAGVGKTYAMLQVAHAAKESGIDVVAGYIEPHTRPETLALLEGLEQLPNRNFDYKNITLKEFDLDAAIKRKPQVILVDELAHSNATGSRHIKRYEDIQELLKSGIDVYTTVNVQHLESLIDIVASITGVVVKERIPDFIFDHADQVELVDIEPAELIERLQQGKIYKTREAEKALDNFFSIDNLVALREISLRRMADRVYKIAEKSKHLNHSTDFFTGEHILICLSPSPSNGKVIRAAARMANAFNAKFSAVYVETSGYKNLPQEDNTRLRNNSRLAEQLGANIITLYGDDIIEQIAEYARISGVSKIVLGRSYTKRSLFSSKESFSDKLTSQAPHLEVFLIPDSYKKKYTPKNYLKKIFYKKLLRANDIGIMALILSLATMVSFLFEYLKMSESNIVTIYILGVLIVSLATESNLISTASVILIILIYNFLFIEPKFTFSVYDARYIQTFIVMFFSAIITVTLSKKTKKYAKISVQKAYRTQILLETSHLFQKAATEKEMMEITSKQLLRLFGKSVVFYFGDPANNELPHVYLTSEEETDELITTPEERGVAAWVYKNNKHAGATTTTLPGAKCLYLAIRSNQKVFAVVGINLYEEDKSSIEEGIMSAILNECGLALEKMQLEEAKNEISLQAQQEQLRSNLLRTISHDLRTPLTSISGNAEILLANAEVIDDNQKNKLYADIYDDSMWLINLVENLLSITRIENGNMVLNMQPELLEEVITEAISHMSRRKLEHQIIVEQDNDFLIAKMDSKLIIQVLINIIDNAIKYTPVNSVIKVSVTKENQRAVIEISDNGDGITNEAKEKLFDMFYTANSSSLDGRRGMGLGLTLCKSIITAHGGTLTVRDNKPQGTIFRFDLACQTSPQPFNEE